MKVLVIGGGGREHALAWKLAQSPLASNVFVAPGNAGTALEPQLENIDLGVGDLQGLLDFAQQQCIDMTVVGPEAPLVDGVCDLFREAGLAIFGPTAAAAQLEGSKTFTKDFLARHNIPSAAYQSFTEVEAALDYLSQQSFPIVIKADGLAAGKGVIIAEDAAQAEATVRDMLSGNRFGEAGHRVVIEQFLRGEEASYICMVDGENVLSMATSQDHKARDNGDFGPNTGGMGAYSPAPVVSPEIEQRILDQVIYPTVAGMAAEGTPYTGFLYAGLMIDEAGQPFVIEFNCRFGDPETQPIMMRLQSDLLELCLQAEKKQLDQSNIQWDSRASLGVVLAAGGYPEEYAKGAVISGLPSVSGRERDAKVFHAGTQFSDTDVVTAGGRVLCAVALGDSVSAAQQKAYELARKIDWQGVYLRDDIGYRAVAREPL